MSRQSLQIEQSKDMKGFVAAKLSTPFFMFNRIRGIDIDSKILSWQGNDLDETLVPPFVDTV